MTAPAPSKSARFQIALPYWPQSSGVFWWDRFDRDEVLRDFDDAASVRLRDLIAYLVWYDFQPDRQRFSLPAMRRLEGVLDAAADCGLALRLVLFPAHLGSLLFVPSWALELHGSSPRTVFTGYTESRRLVRDLFADQDMVDATKAFVREIVGSFSYHPAVADWVLGDRLMAARRPSRQRDFIEWITILAETARSSGATQPIWHGLSSCDVTTRPAVPVSTLGERGVRVQIYDDWRPAWAGDSDLWPSFLAAFVTRLSGLPPTILLTATSVSPAERKLPTAAVYPPSRMSIERQVLRVREMGGAGIAVPSTLELASNLSDFPVGAHSVHDVPTLSRLSRDTFRFMADVVGDPGEVRPVPDKFPHPDPEQMEHDPEAVSRACFRLYAA